MEILKSKTYVLITGLPFFYEGYPKFHVQEGYSKFHVQEGYPILYVQEGCILKPNSQKDFWSKRANSRGLVSKCQFQQRVI